MSNIVAYTRLAQAYVSNKEILKLNLSFCRIWPIINVWAVLNAAPGGNMRKQHFILAVMIIFIMLAALHSNAHMCVAPRAVSIEQLVSVYADKHGLPVHIFRAILMQESSLRINAVNAHSSDYGIGQINIANIKRLGLDKQRLVTDKHYSVEQSAIFLAGIMHKYASKEPTTWWTRYHSFTPSKRLKYQLLVQRHIQERNVAQHAK